MASYYSVPPTTNTLEPSQRKQLLKSTQKLGALLGTTPRVLESGSALPPPLTPGSKALRREGKVFYAQSASSSRTSLDSCEAESYIWIPSPAEMLTRHYKSTSSPISIEFPHVTPDAVPAQKTAHKRSKTSHQHKTTAPQQLSQPLLYRLRSRPTPPRQVPPPFVDVTTRSPSSPTTLSPSAANSDRRRKMAKLMRTLGETIPPELVFGHPPPRTTSLTPKPATTTSSFITAPVASTTRAPSRRRRSEAGRHRPIESRARSNSSTSLAPSSPAKSVLGSVNKAIVGTNDNLLSETSKPSPQTPVVSDDSPLNSPTTPTATITTAGRKHRPRSITLTHISLGPRQGVIVEQVHDQSPSQRPVGHQTSRSLDETDRNSAVHGKDTSAPTSTVHIVEYGYRKERDWSGEWNVKDMEKVVNALRGLRMR